LKKPLVSIIVPLYNHAKYIEASLDSFVSEGYPNLEVVVIDDGSHDSSFEVAQTWFETRPKAFSQFSLERQENMGITKTLNRLIKRSSGEFITMVASDDLLLPGGIQIRMDALVRRSDWLSVFADASVVNELGNLSAPSALKKIANSNLKTLQCDDFRAQELILRWSVPGPVLLSRREAFDPVHGVGPFNESMFLEDRDFYLKLLSNHALGFVNAKVAAYRVHQNNTIRSQKTLVRVYRAMYEAETKNASVFTKLDRLALKMMAYHSSQNLKRIEGTQTQKLFSIAQLVVLETFRLTWCAFNDTRVSVKKALRKN
jgi:glycosyltransferase involved in cell wall biosynthesis